MALSTRLFNIRKLTLSLLILAVLIISPQLLWAQQLEISLDKTKLRHLSLYYQPKPIGLSVVERRQPLLLTNFRVSRAVQFYPMERWAKIEYNEGGYEYYEPLYIPLDSYIAYELERVSRLQWEEELHTKLFEEKRDDDEGGIRYEIPIKFPSVVRSIIGEGGPALKVTGYRRISLSGKSDWDSGLKNTATYKQSKFPNLHMEQESNFKITGTIGDKIEVEVDQDSRAMSDLENRIHLKYTGYEDEIVKSIEAGNTNLSLGGSQFVGYSGNVQGLFGLKGEAQVGDLDITVIASQEKGSTEKTTFTAGAKPSENIVRDINYVPRQYFSLGTVGIPDSDADFWVGDSISNIAIYVDENSDMNEQPKAIVSVGPDQISPNISPDEDARNEWKQGFFKQLEPHEYEIYSKQFYIILNRAIYNNTTMGAYIEYVRPDGNGNYDTFYYGSLDFEPLPDDSLDEDVELALKLIWHGSALPTFTTWDYQWRNVYSLGSTNISPEGLEVSIFKGASGGENPETDSWQYNDTPYLQVFGLDSLDLSGQSNPDNVIDMKHVYLGRGVIIFPNFEPFDNETLPEGERVTAMYNSIEQTTISQDSKYYLVIKTSSRDVQFSLGYANIIEGSDVVKLNGRKLQRGKDYSINYSLGQITFLTDEASDPNANITIDFEYAPFLMVEKKSLLGSRLEYNLSDDSKLGFTALYKSESSGEQKPRVGEEPSRNFVWDTDLTLAFEPFFLTQAADALPLVQTEAPSSFDIQAEFAQSVPNPNTEGESFVDDFEAAREYTDMSILRGTWTLSSRSVLADLEEVAASRSEMWWYNPYDQIRLTDIWPEREVKESENVTNILKIEYFPEADTSWAGIMRYFPAGFHNQSRAKFIEIWIRKTGDSDITMNIDLGRISEDIDGDGVLDTEDGKITGIRDGILEDEEDTGLDSLFSREEPGYDPVTNPDPNGDDWDYSDRYDYSKINGTENNREDPDRGRKPDTEDLNGNDGLDRANSYFSYSFDLDGTEFFAEATHTDSIPWKLFRIPLREEGAYDSVGTPVWEQIEYARVWFTGADSNIILQIAQFQLVGNKYQLSSITGAPDFGEGEGSSDGPIPDPLDPWLPTPRFDVTVKNTHENPSYYPPPGVEGERDPTSGLLRKEQSLVLQFENLYQGQTAIASRVLYAAEDYSNYEEMRMFVHGDSSISDGHTTFIYRMGQDSLNYYEFHTPVKKGWDSSNEMVISFPDITALKNYAQMNQDTTGVVDTTQGNYRIVGEPRLTTIRWFGLGVQVDSAGVDGLTGEVWVDELRLTNARNNVDWAARVSVDTRIADFATFSASYQRKGPDFVTLLEKYGSGSETTQKNVRGGLSLHKFLPPSWGINIPVSASWSNSVDLPRLKPGSDIVLPEELRYDERRENTVTTFNISESMNMKTDNWLIGATLNRLSGSYSSSYSETRSPSLPLSTTDKWTVKGKYDLSIRSQPKLSVFKWMENIFLLNKLSNSDIYYLPKTLVFDGTVSSQTKNTITLTGRLPTTYTRDLTINGSTQYDPFSALTNSFNFTALRDIRNDDEIKLSFDPNEIKLGRELDYRQSYNSSWRPQLVNFLDTRFSYASNYHHNSDPKTNLDSTYTVTNGNNVGMDGSLDLQRLFGSSKQYSPGRGQRGGTPGGRDRGGESEEGEELEGEEDKGPMPGSPVWLWYRFRGLMSSIDPIRVQLSRSKDFAKPYLVDEPGWMYKFGFVEAPGVPTKQGDRIENSRKTLSDNYSFRSGISPFKTLSIDFSYTKRTTTTHSSTAEPTRSNSVTFPDLGFNLTGLEKVAFLNKIASSSSLQSAYSVKEDIKDNPDTGVVTNRDETISYRPLFSWTLNWNNGLKTSLKYDKSKQVSENLREGSESTKTSTSSTISLSLNYSFKAPQGIKLPFLNRIKFDSQLSLSASITKQEDQAETKRPGSAPIPDTDRGSFSISFNANYSFSSKISGGLKLGWTDSDDRILKKQHHTREIGISVEIRF